MQQQTSPRAAPASEVTAAVLPAQKPGARLRSSRHYGLFFSFVLIVLIPAVAVCWYLYKVADDQFASTVAFSVRKEEAGSAVEFLGGIAGISTGSTSDADILYKFIQSQELVQSVDDQLDLRSIYSRPEWDPVFAFDPDGTIEDLLSYWSRMVRISYDSSTGLIELRVLAFSSEDATKIALTVFDKSSEMINRLTSIARKDTIGYTEAELQKAVNRLKDARSAMTQFRNEYQIVDPEADIQAQMGLLNTLQTQLAEAYIDLDLLRDSTRQNDPRVKQAELRIFVIEKRVAAERHKLGAVGSNVSNDEQSFSNVMGVFERLTVDLEFAQASYLSALATYDAAVAEAQRQSRYLAAHIRPTKAEKAEFPDRLTISFVFVLFILFGWAIAVLIYYSIRDRK